MTESSSATILPWIGAIVCIFLIQLLVKRILALTKLPPGPWGLPFIGSMYHILTNNIFVEFDKYRAKYGDVFSIGIGYFNVVVISGHKLIHEAYKRDEFLGRPDVEGWVLRNMGLQDRGILFCNGNSTWNEQRRFALRNLRDFGFGKESMEGLLVHELQQLVSHLKREVGKPADLRNIFNASVLNSLWYILTGHRFNIEDPVFRRIIGLFTTNVKEAHVAGPGFFYSWPAKYNLVAKGKWERFAISRKDINDLIKEEVKKHEAKYTDGDTSDFIDVYLQHARQSGPNSSFFGEDGKKNLIATLHDLFVAGAETTSTTLLWCLLFLSRDARIQDKLWAEVETVIGQGRLPSRDDKSSMPYTEAVLSEVYRHSSLLPYGVYHKVMENTKLDGHVIPKGTVIFANMYGAHHDKEYWKDPENFRPERFLDPTGTKVVKHEALLPFSTGKRTCLGETLARDTLFLFLTGIIQQFSFTLVPGSTNFDPKAYPQNCSVVLQPEPFQIILKNRA